jgi:spore coat protein U-like protein
MMLRRALRALLPALMVLAWAGSASATTPITSSMPLSASVSNSCRIVSLDSLAFGTYSPISGAAGTTTGNLALICTKATAASAIPVSGGAALTGAGGSLSYALFTDSAMSKVWGQPTQTTATINFYNGSNFIYFKNSTTTSQSGCANNANGALYAWWSATSLCYYNYTATTSSYGITNVSQGTGLAYASGTNISSPSKTTYGTIFIPNGSTGSSYTYTVVTGVGSNATLSGTSASAATAMSLPYYAKIPAGQDMVPGSYSDTVTVQVSF